MTVADAPQVAPDSFLAGLIAGWNALVAFLAGLLVVVGVALPWLGLAGLIALVVVLIVRRARRRAAARAEAAAAAPESKTPNAPASS